jgi:four helix bundle protein
MAGWKDFNEIVAWQLAQQVKLRVYSFIERPHVRTRFAYCDDMARAARSGPSNIAEGFGRFGNKVFANHARIAKASLVEVLNHFIDARDQRLLTRDEFLLEEHQVRKALKATVGLIRHLESMPDPPRPASRPRGPETGENPDDENPEPR